MAFDQPAKTCHESPAESGPRGENKGKELSRENRVVVLMAVVVDEEEFAH